MDMEMAMEMGAGEESGSSWWRLMMTETAKKELEMLESNHPNHFEFFKTELKSLIHLHNNDNPLPTSSIATQASTSAMKRKGDDVAVQHRRHHHRQSRGLCASAVASQGSNCGMMEGRRRRSCLVKGKRVKMVEEDESVEVALKRAKACLQKIQDLKTQLMIC